ncbi:MAG: hypothetical protein LBJ88_03085 [Campylobacteraceae bacterium]|nr:hypothetical protein [Campylobacteraceae bacterium]
MEQGAINLSDVKLGVWYKAGENTPLTSHNLDSDTALYAVANIVEITSQDELASINTDSVTLAGKYILLNDINLDESGAGFEDTLGWIPIGNLSDKFTGIFNGNFHKITNMWTNRTSTYHVGFFGSTDNAQIKNLGVEIAEGMEIRGFYGIGGIAGFISHSNITNVYSVGNISGYSSVGGIVGYVSNSNIANAYSTGNINGNNSAAGGIVGDAGYINITNAYSTGNVSSYWATGGIIGYFYIGIVTNVYSTGNISGYNYIGGIAGRIYDNSNVSNVAAINGLVSGNSEVNRVAGGHISVASNNFALNSMSGSFSNSGDIKYHGTDKTEAELKIQETYLNDLSWNFGNNADNPWVWGAFEGYAYPTLYWQTQKP